MKFICLMAVDPALRTVPDTEKPHKLAGSLPLDPSKHIVHSTQHKVYHRRYKVDIEEGGNS